MSLYYSCLAISNYSYLPSISTLPFTQRLDAPSAYNAMISDIPCMAIPYSPGYPPMEPTYNCFPQACPRNSIITNEIFPINKAFSTDCIISPIKTEITGNDFSQFPFFTFRQSKVKAGIIIAGIRH